MSDEIKDALISEAVEVLRDLKSQDFTWCRGDSIDLERALTLLRRLEEDLCLNTTP